MNCRSSDALEAAQPCMQAKSRRNYIFPPTKAPVLRPSDPTLTVTLGTLLYVPTTNKRLPVLDTVTCLSQPTLGSHFCTRIPQTSSHCSAPPGRWTAVVSSAPLAEPFISLQIMELAGTRHLPWRVQGGGNV